MSMNFQEFLRLTEPTKNCPATHFKRFSEPILNSHHPEIKDEVFTILPHDGLFEVIYTHRDNAERKTYTQSELEQVFNERKWSNFMAYDPDCDMLEWLEHPFWSVYT